MAYLSPEGRHHQTYSARKHNRKKPSRVLTLRDRLWLLGVFLLPLALLATKPLPHTHVIAPALLALAVGAALYRLWHEPRSRHGRHRVQPPAGEAVQPTQVDAEEPQEPVVLTEVQPGVYADQGRAQRSHRPSWLPTKGEAITLVAVWIVVALAAVDRHMTENAREVSDDVDRMLGLPGQYWGYGGQYVGPYPQRPAQPFGEPPTDVYLRRQWASLHGYDQARFTEQGQREWASFF